MTVLLVDASRHVRVLPQVDWSEPPDAVMHTPPGATRRRLYLRDPHWKQPEVAVYVEPKETA